MHFPLNGNDILLLTAKYLEMALGFRLLASLPYGSFVATRRGQLVLLPVDYVKLRG